MKEKKILFGETPKPKPEAMVLRDHEGPHCVVFQCCVMLNAWKTLYLINLLKLACKYKIFEENTRNFEPADFNMNNPPIITVCRVVKFGTLINQ